MNSFEVAQSHAFLTLKQDDYLLQSGRFGDYYPVVEFQLNPKKKYEIWFDESINRWMYKVEEGADNG